VEIPVARVEDVGEAQVITRADAVDVREHFGQARARHDRVLQHQVGREPTHRAERAFARRP